MLYSGAAAENSDLEQHGSSSCCVVVTVLPFQSMEAEETQGEGGEGVMCVTYSSSMHTDGSREGFCSFLLHSPYSYWKSSHMFRCTNKFCELFSFAIVFSSTELFCFIGSKTYFKIKPLNQ